MEEIINKPDSQFKDILNDLIDYSKDSEEKSALIEEVCRTKHASKPAASLNSSIYSSAASSSSSTSSSSDSSTNSASSSSTSSTLSSPSQNSQSNGNDVKITKTSPVNHTMRVIKSVDKVEIARMEELGKKARILEHRITNSSENDTANNSAGPNHSGAIYSRLPFNYNGTSRQPASSISQTLTYQPTEQKTSITSITNDSNVDNNVSSSSWKLIGGKRDKRRRKLTEQPVLSQHIPGHKGEQEVDWLVNFIESGTGGATNINNLTTRKSNKTSKSQNKKQSTNNMDSDRENHQQPSQSHSTRKTNNNKSSSSNIKPAQTKVSTSAIHIAPQVPLSTTGQRRATVQNSQPQQSKQQQSHTLNYTSQRKDINQKTADQQSKCNHELKGGNATTKEAVVTFADHIRVSDEDVVNRYTFGFFEDQRQQSKRDADVDMKVRHNENHNTKSAQNGQKHKMKYPKASPNSEQKRYKCNDKIDANSFNYQQILEFISKSWDNTAKTHRSSVKHNTTQ